MHLDCAVRGCVVPHNRSLAQVAQLVLVEPRHERTLPVARNVARSCSKRLHGSAGVHAARSRQSHVASACQAKHALSQLRSRCEICVFDAMVTEDSS